MLLLDRKVGEKIIINETMLMIVSAIKHDHIVVTMKDDVRGIHVQYRVPSNTARRIDQDVRLVYRQHSINQVRLGFEAPKRIIILRMEVYLRAQRKRTAA